MINILSSRVLTATNLRMLISTTMAYAPPTDLPLDLPRHILPKIHLPIRENMSAIPPDVAAMYVQFVFRHEQWNILSNDLLVLEQALR